jgi:serine/threonine protein kinase
MGTSHYMSPEQARGKPVDARSDIWSLGVVIYEMVAGRTPFEGETSTDVIVAITQKEPPPLARFAPERARRARLDRDEGAAQGSRRTLPNNQRTADGSARLKQRLEFETELERSAAPWPALQNRRSATSCARRRLPGTRGADIEKTISHVSSAEYIATGIKRHKIAAASDRAGVRRSARLGVLLLLSTARSR